MPQKKDYKTITEKVKEEFDEGMENLDTQRDRREALEAANAVIAAKTAAEERKPVEVEAKPWGKK